MQDRKPFWCRIPSLAVAVAIALAAVAWPVPTEAIPQFARRYEVSCSHCHAIPPKLNAFGEEFLAQGYRSEDLEVRRGALPALWVTGRAESRRLADGEREEIDPFLNRVELISGGRLAKPWLSYFVEWRTVSQGTRGDGTLRNRSGRFEDLLVNAQLPKGWELTVGQFRQVDQEDVSRRLSLSEPLVLGTSLPGEPEPGDDAREASLRSFSPGGRSPSVRFGRSWEVGSGWSWTTSAALPVPGELSIPLNSEAEVEASHEIDFDLKGIVVESYLKRGVTSFGGHLFYDDSDRYLVNGIASDRWGDFWWTAMAGVARSRGTDRARWSLDGQYIPTDRFAVGARIEDQAADAADTALIPYLTWHFSPGKFYRFTLTAEQRIQEDRNTTLLEVGILF